MYHYYEAKSGQLITSGSKLIDDIRDGISVKELPKNESLGNWNAVTLMFDLIRYTELTRENFYRKVGLKTLERIITASKTDSKIEAYLEYTRNLDVIDTTSQDLEEGLSYLVSTRIISQAESDRIKG